MLIKVFGILMTFTAVSALAHPVIYKEGIVVSSSNMESYSDNQFMYSWSNKWSSGLNHWRFTKDDKNTEFGFLKINHLLYRQNGEHSQGNIYVHGGVGVADSKIKEFISEAG